jgi:hypothetical protein
MNEELRHVLNLIVILNVVIAGGIVGLILIEFAKRAGK